MPSVHLRPIDRTNLAACLALRVSDEQAGFVASNARSLTEAYVNPALVPLAVYPEAACGWEGVPPALMVGFTMYELVAGVRFILRLMIDTDAQGQGYGQATMLEVSRRLRLTPEVELIATSHHRDNLAAARLCASLGFTPWEIAWARDMPGEIYLAFRHPPTG